MAEKKFLLLGVFGEERFEGYSKLLSERKIPQLRINYFDLISGTDKIPSLEGNNIVKLFSPWSSYDIRKHFYNSGNINNSRLDKLTGESFKSSLPETTEGFKIFLSEINKSIENCVENPMFVNYPEEIRMGRDKSEMSKFFIENNISHPETYFDFNDYKDILDIKENNDVDKLYIKIHSGSLGRGISIIDDKGFYSTIEIESGKFVAGTSARKIENELEQHKIIEFMIDMKSIAQKGIEMAKIDGSNYDVRTNFVYGSVPLSGLRISNTLVTNWALGGQWIEERDIGDLLPAGTINKYKDLSLYISKKFKSNELGLDICFDKSYDNAYCLESNFFPGMTEREINILYNYEINKNLYRLEKEII